MQNAFTVPPTRLDKRISRTRFCAHLEQVANLLQKQGVGVQAIWVARDEEGLGDITFPALVALGWEFIPTGRYCAFWAHDTSRGYIGWQYQPRSNTPEPPELAHELMEKILNILLEPSS